MNDTIEKKTKKIRQHCDAPIVSWRLAGPFQQLVRHGSIHAIGQFPGRRWPKVAASRDFVPHRIVHQTLPSQHHIQGLKATALFVEIESIKRCGRALTSSAGPVLFIFTSEKITTVLVGPCMFKPTGPPHLTASLFGSCATAYTRTDFGILSASPICLCGTHSVSSGLGFTSNLQTSTCDAFCNQSIGSDLAKQVCIYCHPTIK